MTCASALPFCIASGVTGGVVGWLAGRYYEPVPGFTLNEILQDTLLPYVMSGDDPEYHDLQVSPYAPRSGDSLDRPSTPLFGSDGSVLQVLTTPLDDEISLALMRMQESRDLALSVNRYPRTRTKAMLADFAITVGGVWWTHWVSSGLATTFALNGQEFKRMFFEAAGRAREIHLNLSVLEGDLGGSFLKGRFGRIQDQNMTNKEFCWLVTSPRLFEKTRFYRAAEMREMGVSSWQEISKEDVLQALGLR